MERTGGQGRGGYPSWTRSGAGHAHPRARASVCVRARAFSLLQATCTDRAPTTTRCHVTNQSCSPPGLR